MTHPLDPPTVDQPEPMRGSVRYAEQRLAPGASTGDVPSTADMILETGVVVDLFAGGVVVETHRAGGCQSCSSRAGCGVGALQQVFGRHRHQVTAFTNLSLRIGDQVQLALPASVLVEASLLMYLLPLIALLVGAVVGQSLLGSNGMAMVGGSAGFILSILFVARQRGVARQRRFSPYVEQVVFQSAV